MAHSYADVLTLKGTAYLNITSTVTAHDVALRGLLEIASEEADRYCGRWFYARQGTLTFDGKGGTLLNLPDFTTLTGVKEDTNADGTFETTWGTADFLNWPYNAQPTSDNARPYQAIMVSRLSNGTQDVFLRGQQNYQLVGTWGFQSYTIGSATGSSSINAAALSVPLNASASGVIEPGMTILIDTEQMYVTASTGTAVTVLRAMNGSTAGTHGSGSLISVYQYPSPVRQAVLMHAGRLFKRAQAGFASESGAPDGQVTVFRGGMDADVRALLDAYKRPVL